LKDFTELFEQSSDGLKGVSKKSNTDEGLKDFAKFLEQNSDELKENSTECYTHICQFVNNLINNGEATKERQVQLSFAEELVLNGYVVRYFNDLNSKGGAT